MTPAERLRRQRRHILAGLSVSILLATIGAQFAPTWLVAGVVVWVASMALVFALWAGWVKLREWRRRRLFDAHVAALERVVRTRHPSSREIPVEDRPDWPPAA